VSTLLNIIRSQWERREQIFTLAMFDLRKQGRGTVLGPVWLFAKPVVYIAVFWFALEIGLRSGSDSDNGAPYLLWLMGGLVPWFYIQTMLGTGCSVLGRFKYLVNKIKFPIAGIPTIFALAEMVIHLGMVLLLLVVYFLFGQPLDAYLLQIPVAIVLMFVFFYMFSLTASLLSAVSKDFKNLITTFSTPLFWLSGIIFNVYDLGIHWLQVILMFNPITFIATLFRYAVYDKMWIWENPMAIVGFAVVFVAMMIAMVIVYKRTYEEVPDVI
jgi:teichoic acid transport system permease protein